MKTLLIALTLYFTLPDKDILIYRDLLHRSVYSSETAQFYYNKTKTLGAGDRPVLRGYKAMASFIMCKHTRNPFGKLSYFNKGKKELDAAIKTEPSNIELLFLRFATQTNTPSFLGYSDKINEDKKVLLNYITLKISEEDTDLRTKIAKFMLQCRQCTEAEKEQVKNLKI